MQSHKLPDAPVKPRTGLTEYTLEGAKLALRTLQRSPGTSLSDVAFPVKFRWRIHRISGARFQSVDLRSPLIYRTLGWSVIHSSRFESVDFDGALIMRVTFENCEFVGCTFGRRLFTGLHRCRITQCEFRDCSYRAFIVEDTAITATSFVGTTATRVRWRSGSVADTTIAGVLKDVTFVHTRFSRTDLTGAALTECAIIGDSNGLTLPDGHSVFLGGSRR